MYAIARFSSSTPLKGADAVRPRAMAVAKLKFAHEHWKGDWRGSHTYITVVPPNTSGQYAIPKPMRHPEDLLDDPGHCCSYQAIKHTNNGQRGDCTNVLRIECGNYTREQETWHANILENFHQRRGPVETGPMRFAHQNDLSSATCGFY